jgi:hypothetical protein
MPGTMMKTLSLTELRESTFQKKLIRESIFQKRPRLQNMKRKLVTEL